MVRDNRKEIIPALPTQLYIETTNRCNSKCNICVRTFKKNESLWDLSVEELKSIVQQFPRLERVVLHGIGEPLLNKDILKMVELLKGMGARVLFNSNASLLDQNVAKGLIDSGLDEYRVSIDAATQDTYKKMRGVPFFNNVVENVKELVRLQKSLGKTTPKVSFWFVGTRENIGELPDLIKLAANIGVREVYLQRLTYIDGPKALGLARENNAIYSNTDPKVRRIIEECETLARDLGITFVSSGATTPRECLNREYSRENPWKKCLRPWALSYITSNGKVLPCCISPFSASEYEDIILGNVFKEKFKDIWNNVKYRRLRRDLLGSKPPKYCKGCGEKWSL
jgi:MoaA/NifB/PqqE/SkfB family radical SAM enzyme